MCSSCRNPLQLIVSGSSFVFFCQTCNSMIVKRNLDYPAEWIFFKATWITSFLKEYGIYPKEAIEQASEQGCPVCGHGRKFLLAVSKKMRILLCPKCSGFILMGEGTGLTFRFGDIKHEEINKGTRQCL